MLGNAQYPGCQVEQVDMYMISSGVLCSKHNVVHLSRSKLQTTKAALLTLHGLTAEKCQLSRSLEHSTKMALPELACLHLEVLQLVIMIDAIRKRPADAGNG